MNFFHFQDRILLNSLLLCVKNLSVQFGCVWSDIDTRAFDDGFVFRSWQI